MLVPEGYPASTYFSDPHVTHVVETQGAECGNGVYGWYTNEIAAHRIAKFWKSRGVYAKVSTLEDYKKTEQRINPLIDLDDYFY